MDGFVLGLFIFAAFLGGFVAGLAGFVMDFVVSGIWLHVIAPVQPTALIAGFGLCTQGYGVWKLRRTLNWRTAHRQHAILDSALGQGCVVAAARPDLSQDLACDHPIRCPEGIKGRLSWRPLS
jgi:hypothetical protein